MLRKFKRSIAPTSLMAIIASVLAACGSGIEEAPVPHYPAQTLPITQDRAEDFHPLATMYAILENFPVHTADTEPVIEGGILRFAEVSSSPFNGLLGGAVFSSTLTDSRIAQFGGFQSSIFSSNSNLSFGNTGIATATPDTENRRLIIDLNYDVYWHDGVRLTLGDLVFAYEIIAHPDYTGIRWNAAVQDVVGIHEFR
ncbi:MAG: hypothetical protein FWF50_00280, partial [Defluviitaleaceae bacterium]|nr:hypothetical protein [Defluviitaleaceae bacterium]